MTLLFNTHTKCPIIEESGWSKITVSLYDDEPCLYNYVYNYVTVIDIIMRK